MSTYKFGTIVNVYNNVLPVLAIDNNTAIGFGIDNNNPIIQEIDLNLLGYEFEECSSDEFYRLVLRDSDLVVNVDTTIRYRKFINNWLSVDDPLLTKPGFEAGELSSVIAQSKEHGGNHCNVYQAVSPRDLFKGKYLGKSAEFHFRRAAIFKVGVFNEPLFTAHGTVVAVANELAIIYLPELGLEISCALIDIAEYLELLPDFKEGVKLICDSHPLDDMAEVLKDWAVKVEDFLEPRYYGKSFDKSVNTWGIYDKTTQSLILIDSWTASL